MSLCRAGGSARNRHRAPAIDSVAPYDEAGAWTIDPAASVWLADFDFWKAWLARTFIAPGCRAVCCDANQALPFARDSFSLVLCSGAFEYIWPRRSFAGELWRLAAVRELIRRRLLLDLPDHYL